MERSWLERIGALGLVLGAIAAPVTARGESQSRVIDGVEIDWGVVPAARIPPAPRTGERTMHGGPVRGANAWHLTVSLRNTRTGQQIGDAQVSASIHPLGLSSPWETLQPMHIAGTVTYGNDFRMNGHSAVPWRIHLRITLSGLHRPIVTEFTHYHD